MVIHHSLSERNKRKELAVKKIETGVAYASTHELRCHDNK
jgi:hypothetical protein